VAAKEEAEEEANDYGEANCTAKYVGIHNNKPHCCTMVQLRHASRERACVFVCYLCAPPHFHGVVVCAPNRWGREERRRRRPTARQRHVWRLPPWCLTLSQATTRSIVVTCGGCGESSRSSCGVEPQTTRGEKREDPSRCSPSDMSDGHPHPQKTNPTAPRKTDTRHKNRALKAHFMRGWGERRRSCGAHCGTPLQLSAWVAPRGVKRVERVAVRRKSAQQHRRNPLTHVPRCNRCVQWPPSDRLLRPRATCTRCSGATIDVV